MGRPKAIEVIQKAERKFVNDGLTSLTQLAQATGVTRKTLGTWRAKYEWDRKRAEITAQPEEIGDRIKRSLHLIMDDLEEAIRGKNTAIIKLKVSDLEKIVRSLAKIDALFDNKGALIKFCYSFVDFVATLPKERSLLVHLKRVLPLYIEHVENNG